MPHGLYCNIPWGCVKKDEISSQLTIFLKLIMNEDENGCTGLALKEMEEPVGDRLCGSWRAAGGLYSYNLKDVFTWRLLKTIAMGQVLSLLICGTAVSCQYLADAGVETPMFQSFLNYALLLLVYTSYLCTRKGDGNILQILKTKWWMYLLMGLTDVEANYAVVKAYQFTTLTSIQSDGTCRARRISFFLQETAQTSDVLLGDGLVLLSAVLYAVSNVCQEYTVKNLSRVEFLGMMGLFGTLISGMQLAILEPCAVKAIKWNLKIGMLFAVYALCMYALYSFMPVVVKMTSATAVNLSLLTADLFSLFCGLFLFRYTFSGLYIISFVVITVGFVMFNAVPTHSPANDSRDANCNDPAGEFAGQTAETSSDRLLPAEKGIDRTETPAAVAVL
uniref:solute carrier family 35 member F2-like n=1 Tax=Centroberyx gerrardi TaxID=166262 RepID=UPI003AB0F552